MKILKSLAVCLLASVIVFGFSSCSQDDVVNANADSHTEKLSFSKNSPFAGLSMSSNSQVGNYLVFESEESFSKISDYVAINFGTEEVDDLIKKLKSVGFISRVAYEWNKALPYEERHPDPAIALLINQDGYYQLKDSLFRDDVQKQWYFVDETGKEVLLASKENVMLKASSGCDPTSSGNQHYLFDRSSKYSNNEPALRIDAYLTYSIPWLGSPKVSLTTESSLEHRQTQGKTATMAYHEFYYTYDLDLNGSRTINNGTTVKNSTGRTNLTSTIVTASSSICFGAVYVTAKVRASDGEFVQVMLKLEK